MGMVRTGKTVICVLLRLQDVEEGVKKAIVFLCLQARVGSAWDAYRGALIDPGATKGGSGFDRWRYAMAWATKVSRRGSWGGECVWRSGRRTCLSCNSALLRMSASASRVAIMQLRMAEASILRSRCGPVHTEGSGLFASRQEREGRQCELMRVSSVCSADYGLRCGAVRWVNNSRLSRTHLTKIFGGQKRQAGAGRATAGQRKPIAVQIQGSTDPRQ